MAFTVNDLQAFLHVLEEQPQSRAQLRNLLIADDLSMWAERFDRLTVIVEQLAEAQRRTEERLGQLAEAQQRTEERLGQLAADVRALTVGVQNLTAEVRQLTDWQRGEAGRREGERYECNMARQAILLFDGGQGGTPDDPTVYQRLLEILRQLPAPGGLTEEQNPFLADLIWWKGEQFVVVEASLVVNGNDVTRAARRAETLQRARVQAMGIVIGDEWTGPEIRRRAEASAIQWKVGDDFSEGWLDFRRLSE